MPSAGLGSTGTRVPTSGGPYAPYTQSERLDIYHQHADQLIAAGWAYKCYCSPERLDEVRHAPAGPQGAASIRPPLPRPLGGSARGGREPAGRAPSCASRRRLDGETSALDVLRGEVTFQNSTLDDFVLMKSDGYPTYHLAAMVDDHLMEITHVLRGEEWLSSAPRHVLIYQAFGWEPPVFAHLSRVLGPDKAKLSKRHGAHAALEYRDQGYLPDAVVNFLALLGWSLDDHTEIIDRETLIKHFDLDRVLPNPAVFNAEKLHLDERHVHPRDARRRPRERRPPVPRARPRPGCRRRAARAHRPLVQERIKILSEITAMADFFFMDGHLDYDTEVLLGKKFAGRSHDAADALSG